MAAERLRLTRAQRRFMESLSGKPRGAHGSEWRMVDRLAPAGLIEGAWRPSSGQTIWRITSTGRTALEDSRGE